MKENRRTTYRISEAARELGISAEWLRVGEKRGYFPLALRDRNGHRYYTEDDIERMRKRTTSRRTEESVRESTEVSGGESGSSETVGE
jgi:DNA-binding transcriptional MerR regulator